MKKCPVVNLDLTGAGHEVRWVVVVVFDCVVGVELAWCFIWSSAMVAVWRWTGFRCLSGCLSAGGTAI